MSQVQLLADYLANGYKVTRLTALHALGIANLTAVVADLREVLGSQTVKMTTKHDFSGRRYAEYNITFEKLAFLKARGRLSRGPHSGRLHVHV